MPTDEELAALKELEANPPVDYDDTQEPPDPVVPVVVDEAAIEARLREKFEAEYAGRIAEARRAPVTPEAPEIPDRWADPDGYDAYLIGKAQAAMRAEFSPLLNRLNQDVVTNELSEGLGDAGRAYVRQIGGGIPVDQLSSTPGLKDLIRNAAENVDRKAQPRNVTGERSTVAASPVNGVPRSEFDFYTRYLDPADVTAILKETKGQ